MKQYWEQILNYLKRLGDKLMKVTLFEYLLVVLLIVLLILFYFIDFQLPNQETQDASKDFTHQETGENLVAQTPLPSSTPQPTPKPIPSGTQTYNLSHGKDVVGPRLNQVTIDPFDPAVGESQTVTAKISHTSPVTDVAATMNIDGRSDTHTFKRISGSDTDGTWQATWTMMDSYDYTYYLFFKLTSEVDIFEGGLTFR